MLIFYIQNVSFKGRLDSILYNDIKELNKQNYYTKRVCIGSDKQHKYNFNIFQVQEVFLKIFIRVIFHQKLPKLSKVIWKV